ncbi:hypothetical protein EG68_10275 [Paragonimus skrjabini miyazakii]|uniref:5-formyltetrahydrofolate cyclo-ligase n=1 Tax=Paragonimus skrjabini miyazakii TaxID=59628 RepID=A0A8S9YFV3_9TREM|nr:hypothetical protein EG68_10275 [Paragonimus skrjabini miyazakii]
MFGFTWKEIQEICFTKPFFVNTVKIVYIHYISLHKYDFFEIIPVLNVTPMANSKALIRQHMKTLLRSISPTQLAIKSERLAEQLLSSCEYQKCRSIAVYLSLPNEPDTLPVVRDSLSTGRKVFVPQVLSDDLRFVNNLQGNNSGMTMQRLHSLEQLSQWPLNKWNIRSPPLPTKWDQIVDQAVEDGGVDLVIVPGLAFTRNGKRLGRGGGYYDRYLNWCRARSSTSELNWPMLVALAFEEQLMEELPTQPHDVQVNRVLFA